MENKTIDLVCYLSNGYPSHEETIENARAYIAGGVDIIEVDLPNENPYIDGPQLQKRMIYSYHQDPSLQSHIETIYKLRSEFPKQRFIILAYESTINKVGINEFTKIYTENDIEAIILVDVQSNIIKDSLMKQNVNVISYVRSDLNEEDVQAAKNTNGFIYLQAKSDDHNYEEVLNKNIKSLRNLIPEKEIYCGVGISSLEDIAMLKRVKANGAFVGSAVFTKESNKEEMISFIKSLKEES